ncbi:TniQ family protein [Rhizobium sp. WSM1325]|uniref:TniQ family protein n=1 Tax=Rhizobium sp. WSM1325 TaxID=3444086 RepID=UPI000FF5C4D8|nr:TniQ family protein [Rhizobium leguminosarum]RWY70045.1 hypothetical protein EHI48_27160 [Rhizobium leguminosarum]
MSFASRHFEFMQPVLTAHDLGLPKVEVGEEDGQLFDFTPGDHILFFNEDRTSYTETRFKEWLQLTASARVYANEMEINGRNIVMQELLDELLRLPLAEEHKESLIRWTPIWNGTFHRLAGETLRKRQLSFINRRFCRGCLGEAAYHRVWWDIVEFNVCPFHAEPLEDKTIKGDTIKWWYPSFQTAPDGDVLRRHIPQLHEPDDFEWYLVSRFGCVECYERPLLDPAPLHEVIDLCGAVGRILANPWARVAPEPGREDCRVGFHALSGSLEDLERAFVTWLETNVPEKERRRGILHGYGWFQRRGDSNFLEAALWPQ